MFEGQGQWLWRLTRTWILFFEKLTGAVPGPFIRTLLLKDTTVGNNIADNVPVFAPGTGVRILGVLRKTIASDLTVRINMTTPGIVILTNDGTNPAGGDTVTLGTQVFKFVAALSAGGATPFEVLIGATADATLGNLAKAISGGPGAGTVYGLGTHLARLYGASGVTAHAITITVLSSTVQGSASTTTSAHLVFSSATFLPGNVVVDTVTIPLATPVKTTLVFPIPCINFGDELVLSADVLASDGSKDANGVASFTVQWIGIPAQ